MPEPADLKVGDVVITWVTGDVREYRARVVELRSGRPVLAVLNEADEPDPAWPMRLKDGDYIIRRRAIASDRDVDKEGK